MDCMRTVQIDAALDADKCISEERFFPPLLLRKSCMPLGLESNDGGGRKRFLKFTCSRNEWIVNAFLLILLLMVMLLQCCCCSATFFASAFQLGKPFYYFLLPSFP
jgi:hypothetical protein